MHFSDDYIFYFLVQSKRRAIILVFAVLIFGRHGLVVFFKRLQYRGTRWSVQCQMRRFVIKRMDDSPNNRTRRDCTWSQLH